METRPSAPHFHDANTVSRILGFKASVYSRKYPNAFYTHVLMKGGRDVRSPADMSEGEGRPCLGYPVRLDFLAV
jgi:hypothetical protein